MSIKVGLLSVSLLKTCVRENGGLGGFAPQTLTRSYYFQPPLSKKRSRATDMSRMLQDGTYSLVGHGRTKKPYAKTAFSQVILKFCRLPPSNHSIQPWCSSIILALGKISRKRVRTHWGMVWVLSERKWMLRTKTVMAMERVTNIIVNNRYCPIRGITNDVEGMISVITSRKT